jgi:hypothetical protein
MDFCITDGFYYVKVQVKGRKGSLIFCLPLIKNANKPSLLFFTAKAHQETPRIKKRASRLSIPKCLNGEKGPPTLLFAAGNQTK